MSVADRSTLHILTEVPNSSVGEECAGRIHVQNPVCSYVVPLGQLRSDVEQPDMQIARHASHFPRLLTQPHKDCAQENPESLNLQLWCLEGTRWKIRGFQTLWRRAPTLHASLPLLTEFLEYVFKERQMNVSTLNNYQALIAFIENQK